MVGVINRLDPVYRPLLFTHPYKSIRPSPTVAYTHNNDDRPCTNFGVIKKPTIENQ